MLADRILAAPGMPACGPVVSSIGMSCMHVENPRLPLVTTTHLVFSRFGHDELNMRGMLTGYSDDLIVLGDILHSLESRNDRQRHKTLGIHVLSKIRILAEVVDGEIVVHLGRNDMQDVLRVRVVKRRGALLVGRRVIHADWLERTGPSGLMSSGTLGSVVARARSTAMVASGCLAWIRTTIWHLGITVV